LSATSDLLEREGELAECAGLIDGALDGSGRLVLVEGGAGIGKTRLLGAAREQARARGMDVAHARGGELEREFAYGIVRQLFEPTLVRAASAERDELLSGAAALVTPLFDAGALIQASTADAGGGFATLHGLFWLTANLAARRPLLLAIDDLHWADPASLRWLAYLVRRLEGLPVLVVGCLRPAEPGAEQRLLEEVLSDPDAFVIRPARLSEAGVARLVREALSQAADARFCAACFEATGGNPFLVRELLAALISSGVSPTAETAASVRDIGPRGVVRSVGLRLGVLGPPATALARAVAVLGDDVDPAHAAALAALDPAAALTATTALTNAELLRPALPLTFVHPIVRAAVYRGLTPAQRDGEHARAAALLAARGAPGEEVAAQLLLTAPRGERFVVAALQDAASEALARQAPDTAVTYLRRALDEPPAAERRIDVLHRLGCAERQILAGGAADHLREALNGMSDPQARGATALELARMLFFGSGGHEAMDLVESAIGGLSVRDSELRLRLESSLLTIALEEPELYPRARGRLERLRAGAPHDSVGGAVLLAVLAYHDARAGAALTECVPRAQRALASGHLLRDEAGMGWCHAAFALEAADLFDEVLRTCDQVLADARARGSVFAFTLACLFRGQAALLRGALSAAEEDLSLAIDAAESHGLGTRLPTPIARLAVTLMERGEVAAAARVLERVASGRDVPDTVHLISFRTSRARLRLLQGRAQEALSELLELGERYAAIGGRNPAIYAWRSFAALALLDLGQTDEARRLAREEVELARAWGAPRALGAALRVAGLAEGGGRGLLLLHEAAGVLGQSPALLERSRALVELGAALRRANRRAEARDPLRHGLELAHGCGARLLAERAHAELVATGARPRRLVLSGLESLTPSERRVAAMAANQMTNRDIAQALFVTPRTVEVHLSSVYRKLGIAARSQLPRALAAPVDAESVGSAAALAAP
jgi:DNA-binding CsgD family transcriptional regulator